MNKYATVINSFKNFLNIKEPIGKKHYTIWAGIYLVACAIASIIYFKIPSDIVALIIAITFILSKWIFSLINAKRFYHIIPNFWFALLVLFASFYFFKYIIITIITCVALCLIPGKTNLDCKNEDQETETQEETNNQ